MRAPEARDVGPSKDVGCVVLKHSVGYSTVSCLFFTNTLLPTNHSSRTGTRSRSILDLIPTVILSFMSTPRARVVQANDIVIDLLDSQTLLPERMLTDASKVFHRW